MNLQPMRIKKIFGKIHLWLGLTSGLLVLIIAVTGCIYAFQAEIQDHTQPYRFVKAQQKAPLAPSVIHDIAAKELPGKHPHSVTYDRRDRAAIVAFYNVDPEYYYVVYIDPYNGEVLKVKNMDRDFFRIILMGHFYLWLPPEIGQPIVASATLIFVLMLISGLILWWPKNKSARKQRFSVKWNAKWRRVNYDLHNVFGFYMTWVVIFIALTGLVWGFQWFAKAVYWTAGGEKNYEFSEPVSDTTQQSSHTVAAVDAIWQKMMKENPGAETIEVHYPETKAAAIGAGANPDGDTYWKTDYRYFDQYSLQELSVDHLYGRYKDAAAADKLVRMNYDIHTGAIWGFPGKLLAFFASLIAASLPVTGFMIWWGRKKKAAKALRRVPVQARVEAVNA